MKFRIMALLLISVLVLPMAGLVLNIDEAYAAEDFTFTGIAQDSDGKPLSEADVRLDWNAKDAEIAVSIKVTSGTDGSFTVVLPGTYYTDLTDSTVILTYDTGTQIMVCEAINLGDYTISGTALDLGSVRAMYEYTVDKNMTVVGTVKYGSDLISGATVTLFDQAGDVEGTDTTEADGKYSIECEPGTYTVTVKRGGFEEAVQYNITVGTGSSSRTCDFYLELTPVQTYWGLDLQHLFTLVGLFIGGILLIAVTAYVVYVKRHNGKLKIVNDEE